VDQPDPVAAERARKGVALTRPSIVRFLRPAVSVLSRLYLGLVCSLALLALLPFLLGWQPTVVMSGSMEPTIRAGDVLAAQPLTESDFRSGIIKPGHVLLAENPLKPGTLFTHRVVTVQPDGSFITRGDNNGSLDPVPLPEANVKGLERLRVPLIGIPIQAVHDRSPLPLAIFLAATVSAGLVILSDRARARAAAPPAQTTRAQATKARRRRRNALALSAMVTATLAALAAVLTLQGSAAAFTSSTGSLNSTWAAAASFGGSPNVASCGGATYTASANTTLTCVVGTVSGTTTNYTLTIKGTGALVQWTVTADWAGVANWNSSKAFGPGVSDTGKVTTKTGYQIKGAANGSTNPADSWNHAWISSTKAAEVFTVQVTTN
jgi:signal peptidase I